MACSERPTENQRILVGGAIGHQTVGAVDGAAAPIVAGGRALERLDKYGLSDLPADGVVRKPLCRQQHAVAVSQHDAAADPKIDGPVEPLDEIGVDREDDHAGKTPVGGVEAV